MSKNITPMKRLKGQFNQLKNILDNSDFFFVQLNQKNSGYKYGDTFDKGVESDCVYLFRYNNSERHKNDSDPLRIGFSFSYKDDNGDILPREEQTVKFGLTKEEKTEYIEFKFDDFKNILNSFVNNLQHEQLKKGTLKLSDIESISTNNFLLQKTKIIDRVEVNKEIKNVLQEKLEDYLEYEKKENKYRIKSEDIKYQASEEVKKTPEYEKSQKIQEEILQKEKELKELREKRTQLLKQTDTLYNNILNEKNYPKLSNALVFNEKKKLETFKEINKIHKEYSSPFDIEQLKEETKKKLSSSKSKKLKK